MSKREHNPHLPHGPGVVGDDDAWLGLILPTIQSEWSGLILPTVRSETRSRGQQWLNKDERLRQRTVRASSSHEERAAQARVADAGPIENLPVVDLLKAGGAM